MLWQGRFSRGRDSRHAQWGRAHHDSVSLSRRKKDDGIRGRRRYRTLEKESYSFEGSRRGAQSGREQGQINQTGLAAHTINSLL